MTTKESPAFKFGNIAAREVKQDIVRSFTCTDLPMYDKDGNREYLILYGVCAGEKNKALRQLVTKANARLGGGVEDGDEALKAAYNNARSFFPTTVLRGWDNCRNEDFALVPFSVPAAAAVMDAIPPYVLKKVITYFGDPANFVDDDEPIPTPKEVSATGKP